jgi:hypothetical protein
MQFLPVLVIVLAVVSMIRKAAKAVQRTGEQPAAPRSPADYDPALAERTRRIQEEIRRKIAERRGRVLAPEALPVGPRMEPPVISTAERAEREFTAGDAAVMERQQQLANQMRALEVARTTEDRRAAQVSAGVKTEAASRTGLLTEARAGLLADLRDPTELRRAFVLREVLGPPVGLR